MIEQIEQAIIDKLRSSELMKCVKAIESYGGQLDDQTFDVVRTLPCVWVVYGGSAKPERHGAEKWKVPCSFAVMYAARSVRSEKAARRGTPNEIGTYAMLEAGRVMLANEDFGLEIARLQPGAVTSLYNTRLRSGAMSVFAQQWMTYYLAKTPTPDDKELLKLGLNYYLKPGDDNVDASDVVTLAT